MECPPPFSDWILRTRCALHRRSSFHFGRCFSSDAHPSPGISQPSQRIGRGFFGTALEIVYLKSWCAVQIPAFVGGLATVAVAVNPTSAVGATAKFFSTIFKHSAK
jgi:hypothetical protein